MAASGGQRAGLNILHLVGARGDHGGILSVLRALQEASPAHGLHHRVWVHHTYRETRQPALAYRRSRFALDESGSHPALLAAAALSLPGLWRLVRRDNPDVLHGHSRGSLPVLVLLSRLVRRPMVFTNHAYARRTGLYRRVALKGRPFQVFLTPSMARHYGLDPEDPATPARYRPGGGGILSACARDLHFERPLASGREGRKRIRLVGVGNIVEWKNWHLLATALAGLPAGEREAFDVEIWGPVPAEAAAQRYARDLEGQVRKAHMERMFHLCGPTGEIDRRLAAADWFVLPSTNEPCSVALIEALAGGVPALVSASGGNGDIVQPGVAGLMFKPESAESLRERLREIREGRVTVGSPAGIRETVRIRSATAVTAGYAALYRGLAGRPDGAAA